MHVIWKDQTRTYKQNQDLWQAAKDRKIEAALQIQHWERQLLRCPMTNFELREQILQQLCRAQSNLAHYTQREADLAPRVIWRERV